MGRIITRVSLESLLDPEKSLTCDALVDTGAAHMTLPSAWQAKLGEFPVVREVEAETATQESVKARVCGPVKIQVEGFEAVAGEVLFLDMHPKDGRYEPLVGYIPLEQSQAAVDMLGHRLVHVKTVDLK